MDLRQLADVLGFSRVHRGGPMPPHCDSMDGPVVVAARKALEARDASIVLPYVPKEAQDEVREAFDAVVAIRTRDIAVREIADLHFFETVVRLHRAGEGAPYTGLKPAGLDHGPVIPVAERALETGSPEELAELLSRRVEDEVRARFTQVMELRTHTNGDLEANRSYVEGMLHLQVWSHSLYQAVGARAHEHHHSHAD
jgi:hypothetical protein